MVDGPLPNIVGKVHMVVFSKDAHLIVCECTEGDVVLDGGHPLWHRHVFIGGDVVICELGDAGHVQRLTLAVANGHTIKLDRLLVEAVEDFQASVGGAVVVLGLHALVIVDKCGVVDKCCQHWCSCSGLLCKCRNKYSLRTPESSCQHSCGKFVVLIKPFPPDHGYIRGSRVIALFMS